MRLKRDKKLDDIRMKLWCDAAVAYIGSSNSGNKTYAKDWANQVLEDFDYRFKHKT